MKLVSIVLVIVFLSTFTVCPIAGYAIDEQHIRGTNSENTIFQSNSTSESIDSKTDYNLPYRSIFDNTLTSENGTAARTTNSSSDDVSFTYRAGYSVKTRGQVDVPALWALDDFSDEARVNEVATITQYFPEVTILGSPTSHYNCHSYAWYSDTFNHYWINDVSLYLEDVHTIRIDEDNAQVGDIIVYFNYNHGFVHSAVISSISEGSITCRSKWGASVLCEHDVNYVPSNYEDIDGETNYIIFRVTPHTGQYESISSNQHSRICTICEYTETWSCNYTYTYLYDDMHSAYCADCDNSYSGAFCTFETTYNGDGTHTRSCNGCSNSRTETCSLEYTTLSSERHSVACSLCDYSITSSPCTYAYTANDNNTHTATCTLCGDENDYACGFTYEYSGDNSHHGVCGRCGNVKDEACAPESTYCGDGDQTHAHTSICPRCDHVYGTESTACTFAYKSNGENTHVYACTQCRYIKLGPSACMFKADNTCRFCGALKDSAVLNSMEEDFSEN